MQLSITSGRISAHDLKSLLTKLTLSTGTWELFAAISRQITDLATLVKVREQPRTSIKRSNSEAFFETSTVVIPSLLDKDRRDSFAIVSSSDRPVGSFRGKKLRWYLVLRRLTKC